MPQISNARARPTTWIFACDGDPSHHVRRSSAVRRPPWPSGANRCTVDGCCRPLDWHEAGARPPRFESEWSYQVSAESNAQESDTASTSPVETEPVDNKSLTVEAFQERLIERATEVAEELDDLVRHRGLGR